MKGVLCVGIVLLGVVAGDQHLFRNADLDANEILVEAEFDMIFNHWDTNNETGVDETEFINGWENADWDVDVNVRLEFHIFDVDDDGLIKAVPDLRHLFKTFDDNGNGELTKKEFQEAWDLLFDD